MRIPLLWLLTIAALPARLLAEQGVATSCSGDIPRIEIELNALNYYSDPASSAVAALTPGTPLAIITATPEHLRELLANRAAVDAFTLAGGWLMLNGLTPEGLASFNDLVGFHHLLRRFRSEKVGLAAHVPDLGRGISEQDVSMRSTINPWTGEFLVTEDAYGWVVDTDDVAPFAKLPDYTWFRYPDGTIDHNPQNLVDGFGSGDSWKRVLALYPKRSRLDFPMILPEPVAIDRIELITAGIYPGITHVAYTFDGDQSTTKTVPTATSGSTVSTVSPARTVTTIGVRIVDWQENARDVVGIDDIHVHPARDQRFLSGVQPITSNGAIVAYPRNAGGILLCELGFPEHDQDLQNIQRRLNIIQALMKKLHIVPGRRIPAPEAVAPQPALSQGTPCALGPAAILESSRADWLDASTPPVRWPSGRQSLGGIAFDFGDQPLAVVRRAGDAPAVIPLHATAQALVFLHTASSQAQTGTLLGSYLIVYADGRSITVPLVAGHDLAHHLQTVPVSLSRARLAWMGHAAGSPDDQLATLYARQWNNPTPDAAIAEVQFSCSAPQTTLALLGLTLLPRATGGQ